MYIKSSSKHVELEMDLVPKLHGDKHQKETVLINKIFFDYVCNGVC